MAGYRAGLKSWKLKRGFSSQFEKEPYAVSSLSVFRINTACILLFAVMVSGSVFAKPSGPAAICTVYPQATQCQEGAPACTVCHTTPPARNAFGLQLEDGLLPDVPRPLNNGSFVSAITTRLQEVAEQDADGDGFTNEVELLAGTAPGDDSSFPSTAGCSGRSNNPQFNVCGYDHAYVFKKVAIDLCGFSPTYAEMMVFEALDQGGKANEILAKLNTCLDSDFWQGRDGALWRMAHQKIRPIQAIKSGAGQGPVPLADYDDDYALFVYSQIDDHDARDVLLGDYFVDVVDDRVSSNPTLNQPGQYLEQSRRAGMITTGWFFVINTMFTALPRTSAAQAYRSYLGLDIAKSQGLMPPDGAALIDYDDKGIESPECAVCHTTLDPLSYPFSRYWGIAANQTGTYNPDRMMLLNPAIEGSRIREVPESGFLLGQPVSDLVEWATVAANSDEFAIATVRGYWRLLLGHEPTDKERAEFETMWRDFRGIHNYRVELMLVDLIQSEAYGTP
jgi:hypothetical protein